MEMSTSTARRPNQRGTVARKKYEYTEKNSTWKMEFKRHQAGGVLTVRRREVVPDDDHGYAAGQDRSEMRPVSTRFVAEQQHRERKTSDGSD